MIKRGYVFVFIFIIFSFFLLVACNSGQWGKSNIRYVDADEAFILVQDNQYSPTFNIIDFRTSEEFRSGHIPGAKNIDYYSKDLREQLIALDTSHSYFVYCKTSNRSERAVDVVKDRAFQDIIILKGGLNSWVQRGYPIQVLRKKGE